MSIIASAIRSSPQFNPLWQRALFSRNPNELTDPADRARRSTLARRECSTPTYRRPLRPPRLRLAAARVLPPAVLPSPRQAPTFPLQRPPCESAIVPVPDGA